MFLIDGEINVVRMLSPQITGFTHSVSCKDMDGEAAFRDAADPEIREHIVGWCQENLSSPVVIGHFESVLFTDEEDAILFYMTFK